MKFITRHFHEPVGLLYHGAAVVYATAGYAAGVWGLLQDNLWINMAATLLWAHALVIAAYMIHECGHNTVFRNNAHNAWLGRFLNWLTGSAYGTFEDIRYKHFRHHMDNDDIVWFECDEYFEKHPRLARWVERLEWAWIPAQDLMMHGLMMVTAFVIPERRSQRLRQAIVMVIRWSLFITVAVLWPRVAIGYVLAYLMMMHVLRFMDALQHDYGGYPVLFVEKPPSRFGGRKHEQARTFSNPISWNHVLPNWLVLNFGFHNAHHLRPTVPWYRLPAYYRENVSNDPGSIIPFQEAVRMYAHHRVYRVQHHGGPFDDEQGVEMDEYLRAARRGRLYGGNAVSFLTPF